MPVKQEDIGFSALSIATQLKIGYFWFAFSLVSSVEVNLEDVYTSAPFIFVSSFPPLLLR